LLPIYRDVTIYRDTVSNHHWIGILHARSDFLVLLPVQEEAEIGATAALAAMAALGLFTETPSPGMVLVEKKQLRLQDWIAVPLSLQSLQMLLRCMRTRRQEKGSQAPPNLEEGDVVNVNYGPEEEELYLLPEEETDNGLTVDVCWKEKGVRMVCNR
jgi:hypothetical protein